MHAKLRFAAPYVLCAVMLSLATACGGNSDPAPVPGPAPFSVAAVKAQDWRSNIGETVEVDGYLMLNPDGTGVLIESMDDFFINTAIPETQYVVLGSENIRALDQDMYQFARVRLIGVVRETSNEQRILRALLHGDLALCEIAAAGIPTITQARAGPLVTSISPCITNPGLCDILPSPGAVEKHAILYSGGINADAAYMRYWNDMVLYYALLTWIFGYPADNIIVVYKDGTPENGDMPVDYPASPAGLAAAFAELKKNMDVNDDFFLFMTNHGGTTSDSGSPAIADEDFGADTIDETAFYYNSGQIVYDDDMAAYVNGLSFGRMCCVMEQCFSGGMIYDLRGPNRVICAACRETEVSYGSSEYDDFVMLWASAMIGINQVTSSAVDADTNNDNKVSVYEAFRWATANDTKPETPQYEDSGEGISVSNPSLGSTIDGAFGSTYFP